MSNEPLGSPGSSQNFNDGSPALDGKSTAPGETPSADDLFKRLSDAKSGKGPPPVHLWNPPYCGDLDIRIARSGLWFYLGTPIGREALVRLFASVLRRDEDDRYYLVTPVEKIGIVVEDVPFVALDVDAQGAGRTQRLAFETNVGDVVVAGPEAPIRIERDPTSGEPTPYILVRARLEARIDRKTFYRLVDIGEVAAQEDCPDAAEPMFGVWSNGAFFPLATAAEVGLDEGGETADDAQPA